MSAEKKVRVGEVQVSIGHGGHGGRVGQTYVHNKLDELQRAVMARVKSDMFERKGAAAVYRVTVERIEDV